MKHKKEINEYVDSINDTAVYSNTMVPVRLENPNPSVTINDVHHMSYDEINTIVNNIERDEKFGIDRGKFKPKMLVKSKDRV